MLAGGWGILAAPGVVQLGIACIVGPGAGDTRAFLATWGVVITAAPLLGLAGGLLMAVRRRAGAAVVLLGAVLALNVFVLFHSERQAMVSLLAVMPALARPYLQYLGSGILLHLAAAVGLLWPAAGWGSAAVPRGMSKEFILLVLVAASFLAALGWRQATAERAPHGMRLDAGPAPDFTLTAHTGESYRLSDDDGQVRVITFGYTHCPDVCPGTLLSFKRVHQLLGADAEHVRFLLVTVDPERDSASRLAEYMPRFHPAFLGLTGDRTTLQRVWTRYGIYVEKRPGDPARGSSHLTHTASGSYQLTHTALIYVIDPRGRLRLAHAFGTRPEDLAHDIRLLLREARGAD